VFQHTGGLENDFAISIIFGEVVPLAGYFDYLGHMRIGEAGLS
jgi:hypothetical protein